MIEPDKIAIGGEIDEQTLFISPTVLIGVSEHSLCMKEEVNFF